MLVKIKFYSGTTTVAVTTTTVGISEGLVERALRRPVDDIMVWVGVRDIRPQRFPHGRTITGAWIEPVEKGA